MKTAAVLCVYNEEKQVEDIIKRTKPFVEKVVVVNDGSTDKSKEILSTIQGITVLTHEKNGGHGAALKTGIEYCLAHDIDWIITLDADGQHEPELIPRLLNKMKEGSLFVVGNRPRVKPMPAQRRASIAIANKLVGKAVGQHLHDVMCGFRAFHRSVVEGIDLQYDTHAITPEFLIKVGKNHKIDHVPINTIYGDEKSSFHPIKDSIQFLKHVLPHAMKKSKP